MRVVNALLTQVMFSFFLSLLVCVLTTQIDKLRNNPNVMILATSNLSDSIDEAFLDRADLKRFVGNPGEESRFFILQDCLEVVPTRKSER